MNAPKPSSKAAIRVETDSFGPIEVPADRYWGAQTQRSIENFRIGGERMPKPIVRAIGLVKMASAMVNKEMGLIDGKLADAIAAAAKEVADGKLNEHFPLVVWQTGSGTQSNMNANEVIGNRAIEMLGGTIGSKKPVHPNDHVNLSQSSNDSFPTAMHIAAAEEITHKLIPALQHLHAALEVKVKEFAKIIKIGRTHTQDATPLTLGQEFSGYAECVRRGADDVAVASKQLQELNIGATAVGTGLNAGDDYRRRAVENLARYTGLSLTPAANLFRVTQSMGDVLAYSGAMRRLAVEVGKVASDLRLLSMGPRAGLSEIALPAVQPGSSIMPGKVNPSVPEMVNQVCFQVMGCDTTIAMACEAGQLELNVMMPVIAWNALHASTILREALKVLRAKCVDGLTADASRARELLDRSTAMATALSPYIGYAATADLAKESVKTGRPIRDLVLERGLLDNDRLDRILSPDAMTRGGIVGDSETTDVEVGGARRTGRAGGTGKAGKQ